MLAIFSTLPLGSPGISVPVMQLIQIDMVLDTLMKWKTISPCVKLEVQSRLIAKMGIKDGDQRWEMKVQRRGNVILLFLHIIPFFRMNSAENGNSARFVLYKFEL